MEAVSDEQWSVRAIEAGETDADMHAFRRLTGSGDRPDQLNSQTFERYQRLASWLYYQNPLARRLADVPTDMVLGAGFNVDIERDVADDDAKKIRELITRFVEHPANELEIRLPGYFTSLNVVQGELFLPVFVAEGNGDVGIGYLEHHLVQDVVWDPNNRMQAVGVIQRPPTPGAKPLWWNVIRAEQGVDTVEYPMHPALTNEQRGSVTYTAIDSESKIIASTPTQYDYAGEILYFRANVLGTGRGRSALEPTLDWLHAYDNFLFGDLRNANLQAAFVWDVKLEGADLAALKKKAEEIKKSPPRPGEVNVHNEKETWEAISPNLNAASHTELGVQVKKIIGLALGYPPHLIGAEGDTNRTTSVSADTPFVRRMEQKQKLLLCIIKTVIDYQLDQKRHVGALKVERPYPYRVILPSMTVGEVVAQAESLYNITKSLIDAMDNGLTFAEDAQRIFYSYGLQEQDVPENILEKIKEQRKDGTLKDPNALPEPGANPNTSGRTLKAKTAQGAPGKSARGL